MNTKRGKGTNSFYNKDLDEIGLDNFQPCWQCRSRYATDIHHNLNRQLLNADSVLNAIPLCKKCHGIHGSSSLPQFQEIFFDMAIKNAMVKHYHFKPRDKEYIVDNFFEAFKKWKNF